MVTATTTFFLKRIVAISTTGDVALSCYNAGSGNGRHGWVVYRLSKCSLTLTNCIITMMRSFWKCHIFLRSLAREDNAKKKRIHASFFFFKCREMIITVENRTRFPCSELVTIGPLAPYFTSINNRKKKYFYYVNYNKKKEWNEKSPHPLPFYLLSLIALSLWLFGRVSSFIVCLVDCCNEFDPH